MKLAGAASTSVQPAIENIAASSRFVTEAILSCVKKSSKSKHTLMRENMHPDYFENALYVFAHLENNGSNYSLELSDDAAVNQLLRVREQFDS